MFASVPFFFFFVHAPDFFPHDLLVNVSKQDVFLIFSSLSSLKQIYVLCFAHLFFNLIITEMRGADFIVFRIH